MRRLSTILLVALIIHLTLILYIIFLANPLPELMNSCPRNKKDTISSVLICILCSLCLLQLHDNPGKFFKSEFNTYNILVSNLTCFEQFKRSSSSTRRTPLENMKNVNKKSPPLPCSCHLYYQKRSSVTRLRSCYQLFLSTIKK